MTERPLERCSICDDATGKAGRGEDSIYLVDGSIGPLCEECLENLREEILSDMGFPDEKRELALIESHRLLKHESKLLNMYDGGERVIPDELEDWVKRIDDCKSDYD